MFQNMTIVEAGAFIVMFGVLTLCSAVLFVSLYTSCVMHRTRKECSFDTRDQPNPPPTKPKPLVAECCMHCDTWNEKIECVGVEKCLGPLTEVFLMTIFEQDHPMFVCSECHKKQPFRQFGNYMAFDYNQTFKHTRKPPIFWAREWMKQRVGV